MTLKNQGSETEEQTQEIRKSKIKSKPKKYLRHRAIQYQYNRENVTQNMSFVIPTTFAPVTTMYPYYPLYGSQSFSYPLNCWDNGLSMYTSSSIYNISYQPIPFVLTPPVLTTICPYAVPPPILTTLPQTAIVEDPNIYSYESNSYSPEQAVPVVKDYETSEETQTHNDTSEAVYEIVDCKKSTDPLEYYLDFPKELFDAATKMSDPNPIIDQFCKLVEVKSIVHWVMDLEFGVHRAPVRRLKGMYNGKYNSVYYKSTTNAIHPAFEGS